MRIIKVHIDGFGKWHDQDFEFTNNPVLIYGANEAGKTTLASFILSILFGFADGRGKNKYQQYLPKKGDSYGGSLTVIDHEQQYVIKRVKGKNGGKVTIVDEAGKAKKADFLAKLLGPMDRELYQAIYSFNQQNILNADLDREELDQQLQQLGAVGSREWLVQIAQLQKKADELYKPRGRKLTLNRHLKEYEELAERVQQAQGQSAEYHQLIRQQTDEQRQLRALKDKQPSLKEQVNEMERLQRLWNVYEQWQNHQHGLQTESNLTDDQIVRVQELQSRQHELQSQEQALNHQLVEQQALVNKLDDQEIANYRQNKLHYQQLKDQLLTLQIQHGGQTTEKQKQWKTEMMQLEERYGGHPLPEPLSERAVSELEGLLKTSVNEERSQNLYLPGIGIVLFLMGMILRQTLIWVIGIIGLVAAGYLWYRHQQTTREEEAHQRDALRIFGEQHGLGSFSQDKWLSMQADLHRYQELKVQLREAEKEENSFDQKLSSIKRELPVKLFGDSLSELINSYNRWLLEMQDQLQELVNAEHELTTLKKRDKDLQDDLNVIAQAKNKEYADLKITSDEEFKQLQAQKVTNQTQKVTADAYEQQLSSGDRQRLAKYEERADLDSEVSAAHQQLAANEQAQSQLESSLTQIKVKIASLVRDGSFSELHQQLMNLQTIILEETKEWLSDQLAIQWINGALKLASQDRYPKILQQAEKYFAILTDHHYQKIIVDNEGISVMDQDQESFQVAELSLGTAEQLFISLRLGFITVISDQIQLSIMVDDGFVNFDNVRRGRMLKLLQQLAEKNQVIYFTANDRIKELGLPVLDLDRINKNKI